jgi:glycosyltransferase involved in cell wall biosynthesis
MHISVAMCTFNGARYLREQLRSIQTQTLPADELVVCDDGSTDQTENILKSFAGAVPFPVRLFANPQKLGPARNFERAIGLCRGELIALSDQDDSWEPEKLARLAGILDADPTLGGVFSDARLMNENSAASGGSLWGRLRYRPPSDSLHVEHSLAEWLLKFNVVTGATLMIRASTREFVLPIPDGWMHDGWIAWMLLLHSGIAAADEPLTSYRIHSAQHAGVSRESLRARVHTARQTGRRECLQTQRQFQALRKHLVEHRCRGSEALLMDVEQKINHLRYRLNLPSNWLWRGYQVASAWKEYQRFDKGVLTMLKDLLVS